MGECRSHLQCAVHHSYHTRRVSRLMESYPYLEWWLSGSASLEKIKEGYGESPKYLAHIDSVIHFLKISECDGLEEKASEVTLEKLESVVAELNVASKFISDYEVGFYSVKGCKGPSPDLVLTRPDGKILIEVSRMTEDVVDALILKYLRPKVSALGYQVDVTIGSSLAHPAMNREDRQTQEAMLMKSLEEFDSKLAQEALDRIEFRIQTSSLDFDFTRTESGRGYPGIMRRGPVKIDDDKIFGAISEKIARKAKAQRFSSELRRCPYVIALDVWGFGADLVDFHSCLYGKTSHFGSNGGWQDKWRGDQWRKVIERKEETIPHWRRIEAASREGWGPFLEQRHLIPSDYSYLLSAGLFLSQGYCDGVTGVCVIGSGKGITFFPNPFCSEGMNLHGVFPPVFAEGIRTLEQLLGR